MLGSLLLIDVDVVRPCAGDGDDLRGIRRENCPRRSQPVGVLASTIFVAECDAAAGMVRVDSNPHQSILIEGTDSGYAVGLEASIVIVIVSGTHPRGTPGSGSCPGCCPIDHHGGPPSLAP